MAIKGTPEAIGVCDPLDRFLIMRLTNWYTHPADNRYHVFEFRNMEMADEFEQDLVSAGIEFERAPSASMDEGAGTE